MHSLTDNEPGKRLDLELFLSAHSEEELTILKGLIDRLLLQKIKEKEISVPASIFSQSLNPGEALVKFLKENKGLKFSQIARLLNKKGNAVWLNYKRAAKKTKTSFVTDVYEKVSIPIHVFKSPELSYLEAIVFYLRHELRMPNNEVSRLIKKSPQVLSIAYNRAKSKLGENG